VADSVALVMASSGEAIVREEEKKRRDPEEGCGERESALAKPRRNWEKGL
jgi:hypothetical protein